MARSGQTHGLNGTAAFVTKDEDKIVSDDLLRIAPRPAAVSLRGTYMSPYSIPCWDAPR